MHLDKIENSEGISPQEFATALEVGRPLVIIDVRQAKQYQARHLPGAINIELVDLWDRQSEIDPDAEIITYCNSGNSGDTARSFLQSQGFRSVRNLEGGYNGWKRLMGLE